MSENSAIFKYDEYGNTREIFVYASGSELTRIFNLSQRKLVKNAG